MSNEHEGRDHGEGNNHKPAHEVVVTVDNKKHTVKAGIYVVSAFKTEVGVPAAKELDQIIHGKIEPLADEANVTIKGHEVFVSHERTGSSS